MAASEDARKQPTTDRSGKDAPADPRVQRQDERIREMERLMRAAAAFARGDQPR